MELKIEKGTQKDIDELGRLYDELIDYLSEHVNYPGWIKGVYPTKDCAVEGVEEGSLFVARMEGRIAGTVILRHEPEPAYHTADWHTALDYSDIFVVHTFAVHPDYLRKNVGRQMMEFVIETAIQADMKAVRLDVYEKNTPAIRLYESCGFEYIDTVDLGYGQYGLDWYKLYQKRL